ncbi:MAG: MATE family efflux transporter, partial [Candidatus Thermoplasmatota archaeon]|jgi:putative MATE family efflux protein|nr:MATE family efflux transporter [Candidatus Thermoplasmatota archaeon]
MGLGTATIAIIARRWGERNYREAEAVAGDSLMTLLAVSIPLSLIGFFIGPFIIGALGANDMVLVEGTRYIKAIFAFYPFSVFILSFHGYLRAAGDTKTPMYVDIATNLFNIGLNYCLIFGKFGFPELGVLGAGIATGCSYLVGAIFYFILYKRAHIIIIPKFKRSFETRWKTIKKMFKIGVPAGLDMGMWTISSFFIVPIVLHFGPDGYSAYQIGFRAESIAYMPAIGFGVASTTLSGQFLGAKQRENAKKAVLVSTRLVLIFMSLIGLVMILFPFPIARIFTTDGDIVTKAALYLFIVGFTEPALGAFFTLIGGMRGAGYTKVPMIINFVGLVVVRFLLSLFFAFTLDMGLMGVWVAMLVEIYLRGFVIYLVFRKGKWMDVKV